MKRLALLLLALAALATCGVLLISPNAQANPDATKEGQKFEDLNADGVKDAGEPGLSGWTVYADLNHNGLFDVGEPSDVTDANGDYSIGGLTPGPYTFRDVLQAGWNCSYPAGCQWTVTLTSGQVDSGNDFGNWTPATEEGQKFEDLNADGVKDAGEAGLSGWTVYADLNGNWAHDVGEPSDVTDAAGNYSIVGLTPGPYTFREVTQAGWTCSYPEWCEWTVVLTSHEVDSGNGFGNFRNAPVPVGGIAELPDIAQLPASQSDSESRNRIALAALSVLALTTLAVGARNARRRRLR